jgi:hypothetical protein
LLAAVSAKFLRGDKMRATTLYVLLVFIGTIVAGLCAVFIGGSTLNAVTAAVFLVLFFANFYLSWLIKQTVVERVKKARRRWIILNARS